MVVAERADQSKHLVAFYSSRQPLDIDVLRGRLGESLPEYMVPSAFVWRERLPLTANSKIDKKTLTDGRPTQVVEDDYDARYADRATGGRLGEGAQHSAGPDRPKRPLLRPRRHLTVGGEAGGHSRAGGLPQGGDRTSGPCRPGGGGGRQVQRQSELLQALSESGSNGAQTGALVCFPYAGGNAVNFQPMARTLRGSGLAVYAVELPGHDVGATSEPFAPLTQVVDRVVAEIKRRNLTAVLLGTLLRCRPRGRDGPAAAACRDQRAAGLSRRAAARCRGRPARRRHRARRTQQRRDLARLSADSGYTELGELDAERAEHVGAAYRHDYVSANRYFAEVLDNPPPERLSAPVTVVVAADDPTTAGSGHAPGLGAAGRARRPARARRRRSLLPAYPSGRGGAGRPAVRRDVDFSITIKMKEPDVVATPASPLDMELHPGKPPILRAEAIGDAPDWAAEHRDTLRAVVAEHGAVVVRGLGLHDAAEITAVFQRLATTLMIEKEAFARRQVYADGVYSSATWPANQPMCMHHELSYRLEVPSLLMFACLSAPTRGGATAVSDSPTVLDALPKDLAERFERDGWLLTRSYNDEIGATLAEAFGTEDRGAIESYCRANAIEFAWQPDGELRTRQRRSAVVHHPITGHAASSTRSPSSTSGRSPPRSASTWWTCTAPKGCRSTPGLAPASRSPRRSWS